MPLDQRPDDGRSLIFDTEPLAARTEILGAPVVELDLAADEPNALVAIRLNDVQPDGTSTLVTYGLLNLTHRESHEWPEPLEPGAFYRVKVQLNDIAHAFPAGHRIRIAVSTSYWPIAWPSPEAVILTLRTGNSALYLPVRPPAPEDERLRPFEPPSAAQTARHETLRELPLRRTIEIDLATNETVYTFQSGEFGAALARIEAIEMDLGYTFQKAPSHLRVRPAVGPDRGRPADGHAAQGLVGPDRIPHAAGRDPRRLPVQRRPQGVRRRRAVRAAQLAADHPAPAGVSAARLVGTPVMSYICRT